MKKVSIVQAASMFLGVFFLSASLLQCTKDGDLVKNLDRTYTGGADSTVFAAFYSNNVISTADVVPDVNDIIKARGVQTIIHEYCNTSNCHGGNIKPRFDIYSQIMQYVKPGDPAGSKLWEYITTNDFDKAMPPVNSNHELGQTDKSIIYNWIRNGAKEKPDLNDFRPAAIGLLVSGCSSANCHNTATATGGWARKGLLGPLTTADTTQYTYINPTTGSVTVYCQVSNNTLRNQVWTAYKDSVKRFYSDTVANASFRPWKTVSTPVSALSTRGPLNNYDDILMDVLFPKSIRTSSSVVYTDPVTLKGYYVRGNPLVSTDCFVRRLDSTIIYRNPITLVETTVSGNMAYDDGGLKPSEVALFKAWYFADPNIPDVWKYGIGNVGIFKYRKTGNYIIKR
ncbi:MAG TPA: c-type cytochrome domain-containing protein [Chitinophagaceae bacterium]|nr:c-type cytochrome domain-containing protein [Chitinophagaceae bacterium]